MTAAKKKPPTPNRAGAIVFNAAGQVLICNSLDGKAWVFPKGHVEQGETFEDTARREVQEETGIQSLILDEVGVGEYEQAYIEGDDTFFETIRTVYYRARALRKVGEGDHVSIWVDVATARTLLTFSDSLKLLARALCWE